MARLRLPRNEAELQSIIMNQLRSVGHVHHHRDLTSGVPDLSVTFPPPRRLEAWLELKYTTAPVRSTTHVKLRKRGRAWTPQQRLWIRKRGEAGSACMVGLGTSRWFLLFWWEQALKHLHDNSHTLEDLINLADAALDVNHMTPDVLWGAIHSTVARYQPTRRYS